MVYNLLIKEEDALKNMSIGEISTLFSIPKSTIRHYIDKGLLLPIRDKESNYYVFGELEVYRVYQIITLRNIGYTVLEIKALLNKDNIIKELVEAEDKINDKILDLENILGRLKEIINSNKIYKLNEVAFVYKEERNFKIVNEEKLVLNNKNKEAIENLEQFFYIYSESSDVYERVIESSKEDKTFSLYAGNYACKSLLVESEEEIVESVKLFISDPLFKMVNIENPQILVYENINLSLVYSNALVYTIEVKI